MSHPTAPPPPSALPLWETLLVVGLFMGWLTAPAIAGLAGVDGGGEALENRSLKTFVWPTVRNLSSATWGEHLEGWLLDHLPGRAELLTLDHTVDYHVLGDSPLPGEIVLGDDGWVWRRDRLHGSRSEVGSAAELVDVMKELDGIAQAADIELLFVLSPTKSSVYPERVPEAFRDDYARRVLPELTALQAFAREPSSPLLDAWATLDAERARLEDPTTPIADPRLRFVFRATDRHHNLEAGQVMARAIVDALPGVTWNPALAPVLGDTYSDHESELSEIYLKLGLTEPYTTLAMPSGVQIGMRRRKLPNGATTTHRHRPSSTPSPIPASLVVVRDSYLDYSFSGAKPAQNGGITALFSQFEHAVFVHRLSVSQGDEGTLQFVEDTDFLVIQCVQDNAEQLVRYRDRYRAFVEGVAARRRAKAQ